MTLMGAPPPLEPPLDLLERNPVPTDPRRRVFSFEEDHGSWVLRLVWDADDPGVLEAEYRAPLYGQKLPHAEISGFWQAVKAKVAPLGPLAIEAADPLP